MKHINSYTVNGGKISNEELQSYIDWAREQKPKQKLTDITVNVDGDYVDIEARYEDVPFERIRRITGYLVGDLGRFNNAKRREVEDRVKHGVVSSDASLDDVFVDEPATASEAAAS